MPSLVSLEVASAVDCSLTESEDGYSKTCVKLSLKVIFLCKKKIEYDHYKKTAGTRKSLANTSEEDNDAVNHESFSLFFPYS